MDTQKYSENFAIFLLTGFLFFHIVEFMIMMPLGPQLMRVLQIDAAQFSYLVAVYNFSAAVSGLLGIFWMDKWDRKTAILLINFCFAVGTIACFLSTTYLGLLSSRIITGAFGGLIGALSMTIIGDLIPFERRGFAMSKLMSGFSLAAVAGVPIGLFLANHFSWQAPFIFVALGSLSFFLLSYFKLPSMNEHLKAPRKTSFSDIISIFTDPFHIRCFIFMILLMFGQFTVIPFISPSLVKNAGMTEAQLPLIYLIGGAATMFSTPLIGKLSDIYSKTLMFRISAALAFIPIFFLTRAGVSSLVWILSITTIFFMASSGRMSPAMAILTSAVNPEQRGRFMSVNSAVQQVSSGLAVSLSGHIVFTNAEGHLENYPMIGYIAIAVGMMSLYWVKRVESR